MNKPEFARAVGVSKMTAYKWEDGSSSTLISDNLLKMSKLSGYAANWISSGKEPRKTNNAGVAEKAETYSSTAETRTTDEIMESLSAEQKDELWRRLTLEQAQASK